MPTSVTALDDDRNVSTAVVDAVADAKGISPTEIRPPLHRVVDADALNHLFQSKRYAPGEEPRVSFCYAGYEITVHGRGEVVVRPETDGDCENAE